MYFTVLSTAQSITSPATRAPPTDAIIAQPPVMPRNPIPAPISMPDAHLS